MIDVKIIQDVDGEWWNSLVRSVGGEFHQTAFHAGYCRECTRKKAYYVIAEEQNRTLGIAMFFLEGYGQDFLTVNFPPSISKLPTQLYRSLWKCCSILHGPLILDAEREEEILDRLLQEIERFALREKVFLWKKVIPPLHKQSFRQTVWDSCFSKYGFSQENWGTFLVDLTTEDEALWSGLKASARKAIKKITKQGGHFIQVTDEEAFQKYYSLLVETCQRINMNMWFHYDFMKSWWEKNQDVFQIFLVEHEGKAVAGQGVFLFDDIMREVFSGTSNYAIKNKLYGGDLLKFETFKWGKEQGHKIYDLAGVNPNPSTTAEKHIRQFKEKWGGKYIEYPIYSKIYGVKRHRLLGRLKQLL